jgi:hypothetical protein
MIVRLAISANPLAREGAVAGSGASSKHITFAGVTGLCHSRPMERFPSRPTCCDLRKHHFMVRKFTEWQPNSSGKTGNSSTT